MALFSQCQLGLGAPDCLVVHRTVSGGTPDSVRCARLALANLLPSGLRRRCTAIIHRTVRWLSAFRPGGSLDRRVNCRRVPQPRWVGARRSTKGGNQRETGVKGKPAAFVLSCAQVGCACSRGLQASAWEGARGLYAPSRSPARPTFS